MISWWWLIPAAVAGGVLGILALALCSVAGAADDWERGYWAGKLWRESKKYHEQHKNGGGDDGVS